MFNKAKYEENMHDYISDLQRKDLSKFNRHSKK